MFKKILLPSVFAAIMFAASNCAVTTDSTTSATNGTTTTTSCTTQPALNVSMTDSTSTSVSHQFGQDCMSCHSSGGGATKVWTVAGSMASANNSTTKAAAGAAITGIGTLNLIVDTCGNFYTADTTTTISGANPGTSTGNTMFQNLGNLDGSCNRSGCHTASSSQGYVY